MKKLFVLLLFSMLLPACETFQQREAVEVAEPGMQRFYDLTASNGFGSFGNDVDPIRSADLSSDPSVQIFPLDGPVLMSGDSVMRPRTDAGNPSYVRDSNIEIYPLEPVEPSVLPAQPVLRREFEESRLTPIPDPVPSPYSSRYASSRPVAETSVEPRAGVSPVANASGDLVTRIYFGHDSKELDRTDYEQIEEIAARFESGSNGPLLSIEGHASSEASAHDSVKRRTVNMRISLDRAYAVSKALVEAGVPASNIRTVGWGEGKMAGVSPDQSRRVEIFSLN